MAVRTKAVRDKGSHKIVRSITITETNLKDIVEYITRNGGIAFATSGAGDKPVRIRIKQRNYGENWGKRDWRVAAVGDSIVRIDFAKGEDHREKAGAEFIRVKKANFDKEFVAA